MDTTAAAAVVADRFRDEVVPALMAYVAVPCVSPAYAPTWEQDGHLAQAFDDARRWAESRPLPGLRAEVVTLPGRTPVLLVDVPATDGAEGAGTVLLYGHLDKQPAMTGWREDLGPWTPVVEGDRLYGRGGADDGYAVYAALTAIEAVRACGGAHARCVLLIEGSEESGSVDLPAYLDVLGDRLGRPDLVIGLDSGGPTFDRLWLTTSLRGLAGGILRVELATEGLHSGMAGGVVPDTFRILRILLDRVEDATTGRILLDELHVEVGEDREAQLRLTAADAGDALGRWPLVDGGRLAADDPVALLRASTWEPTLAVTGLSGAPPVEEAGNVLRPMTAAKLSFRLPPTVDAGTAQAAIERALREDPPYGARVTFEPEAVGDGWEAGEMAGWLDATLEAASTGTFGAPARRVGIGGSIPFMAMLGQRFPDAQIVITGVLGPGANEHGPNESLHLPSAERVTTCVAAVLDAHARRGA